YLNLRGEMDGEKVELRRLGLIVDQQTDRNLLSSVPVMEPLVPGRDGFPDPDGAPRLVLRWGEGGMVRLVVEDPCGTVIAGAQQSTPCQGTSPLVQTGTLSGERFSYFENMTW